MAYVLQLIETTFTKELIAFSGLFQNWDYRHTRALFICHKNSCGRCNQLCAKGGKYENHRLKTFLCFTPYKIT